MSSVGVAADAGTLKMMSQKKRRSAADVADAVETLKMKRPNFKSSREMRTGIETYVILELVIGTTKSIAEPQDVVKEKGKHVVDGNLKKDRDRKKKKKNELAQKEIRSLQMI